MQNFKTIIFFPCERPEMSDNEGEAPTDCPKCGNRFYMRYNGRFDIVCAWNDCMREEGTEMGK